MSNVSFEVQGKDDAIFVKITDGTYKDVTFIISNIAINEEEEGKVDVDYELISSPDNVNLVGDVDFETILGRILNKIITHALSGDGNETGNSDTEQSD